ncbi:MAG: sigma-70 family RNA polymerase sigma factor [Gemmatimonadetes bacterium]|nr:sigma-70 family RNA polymerase sigma factor [Gemmatimonadota bacterium]MCC7131572.1 sigma-70 family RNA polymerase sigma factor [Gemmatimonadales bacterium]
MTPTDEELVASYRAGVEAAADELVRRHATSLGRFLYGSGAPAAELDDLVQEAFFRAFRGLDGWRGEASFRSWLYRIGTNLNRDRFRRQKGRQMVPIEDQEIPDHADPEGEAGANEMETRLLDELERLPRLQREVFLLRAQQGLEYDQICATLGTTPGAARVHYHHAVKRLKEAVG